MGNCSLGYQNPVVVPPLKLDGQTWSADLESDLWCFRQGIKIGPECSHSITGDISTLTTQAVAGHLWQTETRANILSLNDIELTSLDNFGIKLGQHQLGKANGTTLETDIDVGGTWLIQHGSLDTLALTTTSGDLKSGYQWTWPRTSGKDTLGQWLIGGWFIADFQSNYLFQISAVTQMQLATNSLALGSGRGLRWGNSGEIELYQGSRAAVLSSTDQSWRPTTANGLQLGTQAIPWFHVHATTARFVNTIQYGGSYSVTTNDQSLANTGETNPFDQAEYSGGAGAFIEAINGITKTADGKFSPSVAARLKVDLGVTITTGTGGPNPIITLRYYLNDTEVWSLTDSATKGITGEFIDSFITDAELQPTDSFYFTFESTGEYVYEESSHMVITTVPNAP